MFISDYDFSTIPANLHLVSEWTAIPGPETVPSPLLALIWSVSPTANFVRFLIHISYYYSIIYTCTPTYVYVIFFFVLLPKPSLSCQLLYTLPFTYDLPTSLHFTAILHFTNLYTRVAPFLRIPSRFLAFHWFPLKDTFWLPPQGQSSLSRTVCGQTNLY